MTKVSIQPDLREALVRKFQRDALQFGEFTLASGQQSSFYLDGKQVTLDGLGLHLVSQAIINVFADHCVSFAAIGGVSMGADPIVGGMIALGIERGYAFRGFLIRKEPKGHGTNRYIVGPVRPGR